MTESSSVPLPLHETATCLNATNVDGDVYEPSCSAANEGGLETVPQHNVNEGASTSEIAGAAATNLATNAAPENMMFVNNMWYYVDPITSVRYRFDNEKQTWVEDSLAATVSYLNMLI